MGIEFMGPEWAEAVRQAWNDGPDDEARAEKLEKFWEWIDKAKQYVNCTLGLQVTDMEGENTVLLVLRDGVCIEARLATAGQAAAEARYILGGTLDQWREILGGLHVGKVVMYRKLLLVQGPVLEFFKSVYYWTESLACVQRIGAQA